MKPSLYCLLSRSFALGLPYAILFFGLMLHSLSWELFSFIFGAGGVGFITSLLAIELVLVAGILGIVNSILCRKIWEIKTSRGTMDYFKHGVILLFLLTMINVPTYMLSSSLIAADMFDLLYLVTLWILPLFAIFSGLIARESAQIFKM